MERKRIEKLVVLLLIGILLPVSLLPFRINADTYQINGHNVTLVESTYQNTESITTGGNTSDYNFYRYTYEIEYFLDDYYLGYIEGNFKYYYNYMPTTGSSTILNSTKQFKVYCNSDSFKFNISFTSDMYDPIVSSSSYITITSASLTKYSDLNSISQIIDILGDIYTNSNDIEGLSTNQLTELENIVANTDLANEYLEEISNLRHFNIPYESLSFIIPLIDNDFQLYDEFKYNYFDYPVFVVDTSKNIIDKFVSYYNNTTGLTLIIGVFSDNYIESYSAFREHFSLPSSFTLRNIRSIVYIERGRLNLFAIDIIPPVGGANLILKIIKGDAFIPICYFASNSNKFSTDFALQFGLSNQLLDDLHIIAQGTNQSNSASGSLDQTTSQFSSDANDLVTIEESFNDSLNDSLENVSPVFNMGSSFLNSANWVSQQFNRIVNNTPFASLITFGLTLGLGLLIIGKVRK